MGILFINFSGFPGNLVALSLEGIIINVFDILSIFKLQLMRLTDASLYFLILHFSSIDS